jgi:hypothetical protein
VPHLRPWDHVQVVPAAYHPPLPWTPTTEPAGFRSQFWLLPLTGIAVTAVDLFSADELGWTVWLSGPGLLVVLWSTLKPACERWTKAEVAGVVERMRSVSTSGLERGRLSLSWGAAVFLPAVLVVVAGSVWALSKG